MICVWLRNKNNNFLVRTLIWRLVKVTIGSSILIVSIYTGKYIRIHRVYKLKLLKSFVLSALNSICWYVYKNSVRVFVANQVILCGYLKRVLMLSRLS